MGTKHHTMEQIIAKLRKSEIMSAEGKTLDQILKALEVNKHTYYRWKKEFEGTFTCTNLA